MSTSRLEAFSDGVLAIIITVMVLELKIPGEPYTLQNLWDTSGLGLLTYLLSFVYIGIYWNNHHHLFQVCDRRSTARCSGRTCGLLFALSLYPFTTAWMDESSLARTPVVVYGVNLLAGGTAYFVLST